MLTVASRTSPVGLEHPRVLVGSDPLLGPDTVVPLFDSSPIGGERTASRAPVEPVGDVLVGHEVHGARGVLRPRRRRDGSHDAIGVQVCLRGDWRGHVGDEPLHTDADHVAVIDLAEPLGAVTTEVDLFWVLVPRHRLEGALAAGPPVRHVSIRSRSGRALRDSALAVGRRLGTPAPEDARRLARGLVDDLRSALTAPAPRPGGAPAGGTELGTAVREHVLENLDDLALAAPVLCARFSCSRATLYRVFQDHGGVGRYVRERRLDRCLDELLDPAAAGLPIGATATRWGFENPSHFHRLFTARFGASPSAVKVGRPLRADRSAEVLEAGPVAAPPRLLTG